ncbi:RNA polymerase subunit sigma-70, partial [Dysosmobacter welbionis]
MMPGILGIGISIVTNHSTGVNITPASHRHPVQQHHTIPDDRIIPDGDVPIQRAVVADPDVSSQLDPRTDIGKLPHGGPLLWLGIKMLNRRKKCVLAFRCPDHIGSVTAIDILRNEYQSQTRQIHSQR